jgi:hypothetical protein
MERVRSYPEPAFVEFRAFARVKTHLDASCMEHGQARGVGMHSPGVKHLALVVASGSFRDTSVVPSRSQACSSRGVSRGFRDTSVVPSEAFQDTSVPSGAFQDPPCDDSGGSQYLPNRKSWRAALKHLAMASQRHKDPFLRFSPPDYLNTTR